MTKQEAEQLAEFDRHYSAKQDRRGRWGVWDQISDHWVAFDWVPSFGVHSLSCPEC